MYAILFMVDLGIMAGFYYYLYRRKKSMGLSLGMNTAMAMTVFFSLFLSYVLMEKFPFYYVQILCVTTLTTMLVGGLFGRLKDEQTIITGLANGVMMGLMAPMAAGISLYDKEVFYLLQILFLCTIISLSFERKRWRKLV
jgi:hypothetical protein